ncbi:hypothetical protein [Brucella pituitosa]|uniref:hypothetical protein n=1 Tax=Brucella pituitosa TaxID=571256 RepID=UPI000C280F2B|nr:hypothetical protein [Brucella pituitosa]PJO48109.1 hypothetical protein CWE02_10340 [Brucella pituitosa]
MNDKFNALFREISAAFARHPVAVDIQSDSMDLLQIVQTIRGEKNIFVGMIENPGRAAIFNDAVFIARSHGLLTGTGMVNVHYRHRLLQIGNQRLATEVDLRSTTKTRVVWATHDENLHTLLKSGDTATRSDAELLGYPKCCTEWHYDCYFARGIEAFADAYVKQTSIEEALSVVQEGWRPSPGWFLPQQYYLAGILASNHVFPFIDHIACPSCRQSTTSLSSLTNEYNSALILACDPVLHEKIARYGRQLLATLRDITYRPAEAVDNEIGEFSWNVKAVDAYSRHSRYLFKALGLSS